MKTFVKTLFVILFDVWLGLTIIIGSSVVGCGIGYYLLPDLCSDLLPCPDGPLPEAFIRPLLWWALGAIFMCSIFIAWWIGHLLRAGNDQPPASDIPEEVRYMPDTLLDAKLKDA